MSRIGKKPVSIPQGVTVEVRAGSVFVQGPKGSIDRSIPQRIDLAVKDNTVVIMRHSELATDRALHGLMRALVANMITGVTAGYSKALEIVGVGFKAGVSGQTLKLEVGFSHPVIFPVPAGIKIETPKPTQIVISGVDKERVGEVAAEIRSIYKPEPYKGKGIRYSGELVRKKVGKAQATTK